ncbi:MAG TPA: serine/threonine-protein kinase, partial [Kofleriaceae bacterium]
MIPPSRFDEYEIVKPLGRGRSGHVFVARDLLLEREVAIKLVTTTDPAPLVREARAAARIQHPNVATLYRVGELEGCAYLVWELVRGKSLEQVPRPMAVEQVQSIARDVSRGLAAAHRRGVLHRDIKPANIVLADSGEAKLVDFGLAALFDDGVARADPDDAALVGTPYFRAPELWRNEAADARTDLYALGIVLYELLAGEGPFRHLTVKELAAAVETEDARPLRVVAPAAPEGLAAIVDRCLRRDRAARFARAEDVLAALELLSPGRSTAAVPEGNPFRGLRAYDAEHRALFFGRSRPLQLALERLRTEAMLVVTGDSGVGKSSLCAAGIVPAIAEGSIDDGRRWLVARLVPGRTPVRHLADALAGPVGLPSSELARAIEETPYELGRLVRGALRAEHGLLLYIDQME